MTDTVAPPTTGWNRSTLCGAIACVQVALTPDAVGVRDAEQSESPLVSFMRNEWVAFFKEVKRGEFDLA